MITIDALGQVCPIPVIKAKKALEELGDEGGVLAILVDNDIARQNLQKMATTMGCQSEYLQKDKEVIEVTIVAGKGCALDKSENLEDSGLVVAIGRDTMGEGGQELGKILLKSFIFSLRELNPLPTHILFFNSGAYLTSRDSNSLEDLQAMAEKGTIIQTCGTCTNYYGISDKLAVGEVANMYGIVTAMAEAKRLINI